MQSLTHVRQPESFVRPENGPLSDKLKLKKLTKIILTSLFANCWTDLWRVKNRQIVEIAKWQICRYWLKRSTESFRLHSWVLNYSVGESWAVFANFFFALLKHRSPETPINLSADLYDILSAKIDHFKPVDPFLYKNKKLFPIWGDRVHKFTRVSSDLWLKS